MRWWRVTSREPLVPPLHSVANGAITSWHHFTHPLRLRHQSRSRNTMSAQQCTSNTTKRHSAHEYASVRMMNEYQIKLHVIRVNWNVWVHMILTRKMAVILNWICSLNWIKRGKSHFQETQIKISYLTITPGLQLHCIKRFIGVRIPSNCFHWFYGYNNDTTSIKWLTPHRTAEIHQCKVQHSPGLTLNN